MGAGYDPNTCDMGKWAKWSTCGRPVKKENFFRFRYAPLLNQPTLELVGYHDPAR